MPSVHCANPTVQGSVTIFRTDSIFSPLSSGRASITTPQPSAIQLREDSSHQAFPSQTWSQHDLDIISLASNSKSNGRLEKIDVNAATSNAPPTSSSFLPIYSDESADEWGQFTDFDDREQDLYNVIDDPFKSISKTILKRRGDKFSFQKLDQLQEEEEYDEHDE